jgi:ribosome-associated protein
VPINKKSVPGKGKELQEAAKAGAAKPVSKAKRVTNTKTKAGARAKAGAGAKAGVGAQAGAGAKAHPDSGSTGAAQKAKLAAARTVSLRSIVIDALDDMKALEVKVLDVRGLTDVADTMVIASGTSDRHVRSVAKNVVEKTKAAGFRPHGVEGQQDSDWVLIDLHEMIVHVMLPRTREFYGLEKLWDMTATKRAARA